MQRWPAVPSCAPLGPHSGRKHERFGSSPRAKLVITSPPYAVVDYSRMWAPELQTLAAMFDFDAESVKRRQVGSTVVRDQMAPSSDLSVLPAFVRKTLSKIWEGQRIVLLPLLCQLCARDDASFPH